ncbi:MAG: hypothetical protein R2911_06010 [Caldilineaceae bacterium]
MATAKDGRKASGLLMVDGTLYMWLRNVDRLGHQCKLAWSGDHGLHWSEASWVLSEFGYCTFINFGQNDGARDGYVYSVSHDNPSAYTAASHFILMRAPKGQLSNRSAYGSLRGWTAPNNPLWSSDVKINAGRSLRRQQSAALGHFLQRRAAMICLWWQQLPTTAGRTRGGRLWRLLCVRAVGTVAERLLHHPVGHGAGRDGQLPAQVDQQRRSQRLAALLRRRQLLAAPRHL